MPQKSVYGRSLVVSGSLTLEQVAARMPRPVAIGTFTSHLAGCLEAGLTFAWDRRRLGIDLDLERKVHRPGRWHGSRNSCCCCLPVDSAVVWSVLVLLAIGAATGELGVKWAPVQCWWQGSGGCACVCRRLKALGLRIGKVAKVRCGDNILGQGFVVSSVRASARVVAVATFETQCQEHQR